MQPADVVDHPRGAPRGLLRDVAGGAGERGHLQHPAAAEHRRAQTIIGRLAQGTELPCTLVIIKKNPISP